MCVIGRGDRPSLYDIHQQRAEPLVPDELRLEISERTAFDGQILTSLDDTAVQALIPILDAHGVTAIAVCSAARLCESRSRNPHWCTLAGT
jgi:N-methylhydantoinase A